MDPTTQFFSRLRRLAVTLEAETAQLQQVFESRNDEDRDSETTARAMRAYHELNSEIGTLKGLVRDQVAQEEARKEEVSNFIKASRATAKRVAQDIQTLKAHWEKYGYQAPRDEQKPSKAKCKEVEDKEAADDGNESAEEQEGNQEEEELAQEGEEEENGENHSSSPPKSNLPFPDVMQTPQMSDFGLSDMQLKRALAGVDWISDVPPMPKMSLPQPSLNPPMPPMPITPKCALRLEHDELHTPQMHDFGISEHTMTLNNDFTMNLFRKKDNRQPQDIPPPPLETLTTKAMKLDTPEPPALCTPGLKIRKTNAHRSSSVQVSSDPESPCRSDAEPAVPEIPAFQTPYMNRLIKHGRQPEPVDVPADGGGHIFDLPTPQTGAAQSKRPWEYDVPDIGLLGMEGKEPPQMPNLESVLGHSLISKNAKQLKMSEHEKTVKDAAVNGLDLDGPTQEFSLGMPRIRMNYQDPSTPEMPDLSSVTQDICKLVSQAQLKKTKTQSVEPYVRPESDQHSALSRAASLPDVSERDFQSLPSYLRQMSLSSLNAAVHSINRFTKEHRGEVTELQMEELKSIIGVGTKAPVYILCLAELKMLHNVGEFGNTSVYKLITHC